MKNKLSGFIILAAIAMVVAWNVTQNKSEAALSDVALANVEALAEETGYSNYIRMTLDCNWSVSGSAKYTACYYGGLVNCTETSCP
jgi:hypothetical protein